MNAIIIHIVLSKLDNGSKQSYEEQRGYDSLATWEQCHKMMRRRSQFLESRTKSLEPLTKAETKSSGKQQKSFMNVQLKCVLCSSSEHNLHLCPSFTAMPVSSRFECVKKNGLCINCLKKGHSVSKCTSRFRCRTCKLSHHTSLHFSKATIESEHNTALEFEPRSSSSKPSISLVSFSQTKVIIPTAFVLVKDYSGNFQPFQALLDSGSEINMVTEETAKRLQLKLNPSYQEVAGVGNIISKLKHDVCATIKSRFTDFKWSSIFAVAKSIAPRHPDRFIQTEAWNIPRDIQLADPGFKKPQRIDMLISSEIFFDLLLGETISLGNGMTCLIITVFGWIVGAMLR